MNAEPLNLNTASENARDQRKIGYCTNVHAGTDLATIRQNLTEYAVSVRDQLQAGGAGDRLGVGLWIPNRAAEQLVGGELDSFRDFLAAHRLDPFTINGFPFDNFHGDHVKQRVYLPTWADSSRLNYTRRLADVLAGLLGDDQPIGSISTLPLGWPNNRFADPGDDHSETELVKHSGGQLRQLATYLDQLRKRTGKHIVVAIEPEPGCVLDSIDDMLGFFEQQLPDTIHRQYITACHDICHSAVMNEPQADVLHRYTESGIGIGKVQVSNAIVADWKTIDSKDHAAALSQLSGFAEDRYLHQTGQVSLAGQFELAEDLPGLVESTSPDALADMARWVVHFHVPIFLEQFGLLSTSRDAVVECLETLGDPSIATHFTGHLEVETYAWTVLPKELRQHGLASDIAGELRWLIDQLSVQVSKNRANR